MTLERFAHGVFRRLGVQVNRPDDSVFHLVQARDSSWRGTLQQYVGRPHRARAGKSEVRVYDYIDRQVPVLVRMLAKRLKGYHAMGYVTDGQLEAT